MVIEIDLTAAVSSTSAPTYTDDFMVSSVYDVSIAEGWSSAGSPTGIQLWLWRKLNGVDTVAKQITLLGVNEDGQTVSLATGQSVTVRIPGNCAYIGVTAVLAGGSSPTFTGKVLFDGQFENTST